MELAHTAEVDSLFQTFICALRDDRLESVRSGWHIQWLEHLCPLHSASCHFVQWDRWAVRLCDFRDVKWLGYRIEDGIIGFVVMSREWCIRTVLDQNVLAYQSLDVERVSRWRIENRRCTEWNWNSNIPFIHYDPDQPNCSQMRELIQRAWS